MKKFWITVLASFFGLVLSCDKCFAIEQRFHSETNGYSFVIPEGWIQIPEDIVRQTYDESLSSRTRSIVFNEAEFQLDSQDAWFEAKPDYGSLFHINIKSNIFLISFCQS